MLCLCSPEEEQHHLHILHIWLWDTGFDTVKYFTGYRCLILFNARGTNLTLWKYTQNTSSCDTFGLSFISRTTIALQGVIFQWLTCSLTLLFITTDYNCEQAFRGKAELWGDWQWQLWHGRFSVPKAPCLASPRCMEAKSKMSKISPSKVLVL